MKYALMIILTVLSLVVFSEDVSSVAVPVTSHKKMTRLEILSRKGYKTNGGALVQPGSKKGSVVFLDQQKRISHSVVASVAEKLTNISRIQVRSVVSRKGENVIEATKANDAVLGIAVVDDPASPVMLVAPEERWATVNVTKLAVGRDGIEIPVDVLASRVVKELMRAYAYLCGGVRSQFEGNLVNVNSISQLDSVDDGLPLDMVKRFEKYLSGVGVTPERIATYRSACKEGWAPQPTNDIQKAIWEKIHQIPTKPIKIEYNEKRDKGK